MGADQEAHKAVAEQHRNERRNTMSLKIKELQEKSTLEEPAADQTQEELDEAERLSEVEKPEQDAYANKYPPIRVLKQNIENYIIIDGYKDLSLKNIINSIASRQRRLDLNISDFNEIVHEDPIIWEFSELLK